MASAQQDGRSRRDSSDVLDEAYWSALASWLDIPLGSLPSLQARVHQQPVEFLSNNIHRLSEHLLCPQAHLTTPRQRAAIVLVRERRRRYAQAQNPEELQLPQSRHRLPHLWRLMVGKWQTSALNSSNNADKTLDPPFPGGDTAIDGSSTWIGASDGVRRAHNQSSHGPPHKGDLFSHPRLSRLLAEQDEEETQIRATEQESEEEEEDDNGNDDDDDDDFKCRDQGAASSGKEPDKEDIHGFRLAVLDRFIQGDPTLPSSLYADIDFDETLDRFSSRSPDEGVRNRVDLPISNVAQSSSARAARERELMEEDSYFDEEEES